MHIGSSTPWKLTPPTDLTVRGTPAPGARGGNPSEQAAPLPEGPQRGDILAAAAGSGNPNSLQRPPEEQAEIAQLQRRDREVRQHEAAHVAAGGAYVRGGASFSYQPGPDGKRYAVGGEVSIDVSAVDGNPEATISKMQRVRGAALAPANPSGQDLAVAARASQAERQARVQAAAQARESTRDDGAPASGDRGDQAPPAGASSPFDTARPASVTTGSRIDAYA